MRNDKAVLLGNLLVALRVAARHTSQATILVGHILLATLWASTLTSGTILNILLQGTLNTILPCVDGLRVEVPAVNELNNLVDRHAVAQDT